LEALDEISSFEINVPLFLDIEVSKAVPVNESLVSEQFVELQDRYSLFPSNELLGRI
jgi:hypothetical protein